MAVRRRRVGRRMRSARGALAACPGRRWQVPVGDDRRGSKSRAPSCGAAGESRQTQGPEPGPGGGGAWRRRAWTGRTWRCGVGGCRAGGCLRVRSRGRCCQPGRGRARGDRTGRHGSSLSRERGPGNAPRHRRRQGETVPRPGPRHQRRRGARILAGRSHPCGGWRGGGVKRGSVNIIGTLSQRQGRALVGAAGGHIVPRREPG